MIHREYNATTVQATVGFHDCSFRSKFEHKWAKYLQWLLENNQIEDWEYESRLFFFDGEERGPHKYLPDFKVTENDGTVVWQECKGYHDGATNSKFRRMAKHYPNEVCELILMRFGARGKGANRRETAERYTRRIIDASQIFSQMKGLI